MSEGLRIWRVSLERDPHRSAHGVVHVGARVLVELVDDEGVHGLGELAALEEPTYDSETLATELLALERFLARLERVRPEAVARSVHTIRGHRAARAALSQAAHDLAARRAGRPLWALLGGRDDPVPTGIALGIDEPDAVLGAIERAIAAGYRRIKLKIERDTSLGLLAEARTLTPTTIDLVADANGAFDDPSDPTLSAIDRLGFSLLEQPIDPDDPVAVAQFARSALTPVCLDESLRGPGDLTTMLALGARVTLNLKLARLGGWEPTLAILARARSEGLDALVGGMYETAVGRAHAVALASLPGVDRPGDLAPSSHYGADEPTTPLEATDGAFRLWTEAGIGRDLVRGELLFERTFAHGTTSDDSPGSTSMISPIR